MNIYSLFLIDFPSFSKTFGWIVVQIVVHPQQELLVGSKKKQMVDTTMKMYLQGDHAE